MNFLQSSTDFILDPELDTTVDFVNEIDFEPASVLALAAVSLRFEAAFLVLRQATGAKILGQTGSSVLVPDCPSWLMPEQPHMLHQSGQLSALSIFLKRNNLQNALGIHLSHRQATFGALWLVNSRNSIESDALNLLRAFGQYITNLCQPKPPSDQLLNDSILQALPIGVIANDRLGNIQQINLHYATAFGYSLSDMQNHNMQEFLLPESREALATALQARARGESSVYRLKMYRKDGSLADVEVSGHPRFDNLGQPIGSVGVIRDITEELALEQATLEARRAINKKMTDTLAETRRSLEYEKNFAFEILEMLQDGFALIGMDGKFEYVNPAFAQICSMNPHAMQGLEAQRFVHPEDLQHITQALQTLQPGQMFNYQHRVRQSTGEIVMVQARANLRHNPQQQVSGILLMVRDISQEIASQAKVEKLEQELERISNNFQAGTGFMGRLETIGGGIGLMQMFTATPINGAIQLDDSILFFNSGKIIAIIHPKLQGEEAVRAVIQRQRGQFQFIPEVRPEKRDLNLDPTKLALELLTKHDESLAPKPKATIQRVVLPNAKAAQAFMQGVGGRVHFQVTLESGQIVLTGRGFEIVVAEAKLEDF